MKCHFIFGCGLGKRKHAPACEVIRDWAVYWSFAAYRRIAEVEKKIEEKARSEAKASAM